LFLAETPTANEVSAWFRFFSTNFVLI